MFGLALSGGRGQPVWLWPSSSSYPSLPLGLSPPTFLPDGQRPTVYWQRPVMGLSVSQGHEGDNIFLIQALFSLLTGPRNKWVWGGGGVPFSLEQREWAMSKGGRGRYPLYHRTLAGTILQFSGILVTCHKPILRKDSHQMFIYRKFINKINHMRRIKKNFHHGFKMSPLVL